MYPILFQFGPITIYSLWVLIAVGFFASLLVLHRLIQKDRNKISFIADHSLVIFLCGIIVSRLFFILWNLNLFFGDQSESGFWGVFSIWDKGLSPWGGIVGFILALIFFSYKEKENILEWLDIMSIAIVTSFVFSNIGTLLDGQNYGRETSLPWGVIIESSRFAVPIHPVQLYAAIYCAILGFVLYQTYHEKMYKKPGNTTMIGITLYTTLRFFDEFLRGDESNYFLGLREAQIYCIVAFISIGILWYIKKKYKKPISSNS